MTCIDFSVAVDLANTLGPEAHERLRHLRDCRRCLSAVEEAAALAALLALEVPSRPGFAQDVTDRLQEERSSPAPGAGDSRPWGGWLVGWLLAGPTTVMAAAAAGTTVPVALGPRALVVAAVWASAMFAWTARSSLSAASPVRG